jgi:two-component system, OmpR family, phosphate regulon sensor histidine kinase PhoR
MTTQMTASQEVLWPVLAVLSFGGLIIASVLWRRNRARLRAELADLQERLRQVNAEKEELVREKKNERQTLFDAMVEGVLLVNLTGHIEFLNLALRRLLSLTSDIHGQHVGAALKRSELDQILQEVAAEGQTIGREFEIKGPIRRSMQVNASAFLDSEGRRQGTLLVFHDVTQVKEFEKNRREFVANVSHELRTPLSLIKGFVETLLAQPENHSEQTIRFLQTIKKHTDRLTFLMEDLLTISRLEEGQIVMDIKPTSLRDAIERVREDLSARAAERQIEIENTVGAEVCAQADVDRLEQVLFNLIENAIKYGRIHGRVTLSAKELPDNRVQVSVQDDGPGIPPESRGRVFERFYRADRARSRETGGTGLGLSIVKHIVRAHSGEVWLHSEMGTGTTFFFTLPQEL